MDQKTGSGPTVEDAVALAALLHKGHKKKGRPYIFHVIRVMMAFADKSKKACMVAVLHDSVEDGHITLRRLRDLGYPDDVVDAIDALSKRPEENDNYDEFVTRIIRAGELAIRVKLADVNDNLRPAYRRVVRDGVVDLDRDRVRVEKYRCAQKRLLAALQDCLVAQSQKAVVEYS